MARRKPIDPDLSALHVKEGIGWFYQDYRIQADPIAHRFAVEYLAQRPYRRVLDLGSGEGAMPAQLIDVGIDASATSWNGRCKAGTNIYEVDLDNGFKLSDVGGEKYDAVTAIDVIEHIENPWAFMRSCAEAINEDGVVLVSTPNTEYVRARLEYLVRGYSCEFAGDELAKNRHITPIWRLQFEAMAAQAGLQITERHGFGTYFRVSPLKRITFLLMERFMSDTATGRTVLYTLKKQDQKLSIGPEEIY